MGKKKPTKMQMARMNPYAYPMVMNHITNNGDIVRSDMKHQQRYQSYNNHIKGVQRKCQKYEEDIKDLERNLSSSVSKNQTYEKKVTELEQVIQRGIDKHSVSKIKFLEGRVERRNEEIQRLRKVVEAQKKQINDQKEIINNHFMTTVQQSLDLELKANAIEKLKNEQEDVIHSTEVRTEYIEVHTIDSDDDDKGERRQSKHCEGCQCASNPVGVFESDLAKEIKTEDVKPDIKIEIKSEKH